MKRCAVVIGVDKTGDLPVLSGVASGAAEFADWAQRQRFDVKLLADGPGTEVTLGDIRDAVTSFVAQSTYSQMVVYFAGHGILQSPEAEFWLLSRAPGDPNEAVNVFRSLWLARNSGIEHIVLISDACRSDPGRSRLAHVNGGSIFPNEEARRDRATVDVFYATLPGDTAKEVPSPQSTTNYKGIFTECLLKALKGEVPEVVVKMDEIGEGRPVIPCWTLKPHLEEAVPAAACHANITLQQDPEIRVESHPPKFLGYVPMHEAAAGPAAVERIHADLTMFSHVGGGMRPEAGAPREPFAERGVTLRQMVDVLQEERFFRVRPSDEPAADESGPPDDVRKAARESDLALAMGRVAGARGREAFETRVGFTFIGADVQYAALTQTQCDVFCEGGVMHIRVHGSGDPSESQTAVVRLTDGSGLALAVLPDFIGTVVFEDGRVVTVNYTPSKGTGRYDDYEAFAQEVEERRAFAAVAARSGAFRLETDEVTDYARYLRAPKHLDPTLGLYAAYAYAQAGSLRGIRSVYRYMSEEREPVLFDVAMLANRLPSEESEDYTHPVAPFCPMLTQGWAFLGGDSELIPEVVRAAGRHLIPGLWTTFEPEGTEILMDAIMRRELT